MRPLALGLVASLAVLALALVSGEVWLSDSGSSLHLSSSVSVGSVRDVAARLLTSHATAAEQRARLQSQAEAQEQLAAELDILRMQLGERVATAEQQAASIAAQALLIDEQAALLDSLRANATLLGESLQAAEAVHSAQLERGNQSNAQASQLAADAGALAARLQALHADIDQHAVVLPQLDATTQAHESELARLDDADAELDRQVAAHSAAAVSPTARMGSLESDASLLQARVASLELEAATLHSRALGAESVAAGLASIIEQQEAKLQMLEALAAVHSDRLSEIESTTASLRSDVAALQAHVAALASSLHSLSEQAVIFRARAHNLESLAPDTSVLVRNVTALQTRSADHTQRLSTLSSQVVESNSTLVRLLQSESGLADSLLGRVSLIQSSSTRLQGVVVSNVSGVQTGLDGVTALLAQFHTPTMHRHSFFTSQTWTVPAGVRGAFVSMSGAGGSGYGWKHSNYYTSGPSGGYVMSQPISLTAEETISITVGKGGRGSRPEAREASSAGAPYYVYYPPSSGDPGLTGQPGGASVLTSPSSGEIYRCAGGGGMTVTKLDTIAGGVLVAGGVKGATIGSGNPQIDQPSQPPSPGLYGATNSPGACGPSDWGLGNSGSGAFTTTAYGYRFGGTTPLGYGAGGGVTRSECYVTASQKGLCTAPEDGRDGVVHLDVWY